MKTQVTGDTSARRAAASSAGWSWLRKWVGVSHTTLPAAEQVTRRRALLRWR